ncbi:LysR family transcriptional regulator [Vibrio sp. 10N.261.55.A7]|uniref:LysR family transcriptional regulator n=1 Tax=Vibrio sp. 10N.261.55.A7 TaxID=1880851 RepID=UPI000C8216CF|nr:LysR family transcriptional regulator [Vibrio sp. 10N.261.55.A7]PMK03593.1 LysR family transcriptional regulator [Vibrio sp. 10N.261.55.A7]
MANISDIELKQLRLLQIIFETKNLTQAGERAGLTQSAVSHILKKLRYSFNDSLVIRQGNKLELTPRAELMQPVLSRWLNDFERNILYQETFDPARSDRTFYIATSDLVEHALMPHLIKFMSVVAPNVRLVFKKLDKRSLASQVESGEVDFAISVIESGHPSLMVRTLYRDDFVSVVRTDHPLLKTKIEAKSFCQYSHVLAGTGNDSRGMVDDALDSIGLSRNVQYKVANFASALYIVESSDGILTAPRKFIEMMADKFAIEVFESPVELEGYIMKLYWHVKNKDDQANLWLRETMVEVMGGSARR